MKNFSSRWLGVISLFVIVAISYIDRINLAVLITDKAFLDHIGLAASDRARQGFLATGFMIGYGLSSLALTPYVASRLGVRKSLLIGLTLWGGVTMATPLLSNYAMLMASRVLLGIAEGPLFSLASSYIKAHFESHENGKPNAFIGMGASLGLAVGYPFIGQMLAVYQWQESFHVLGWINLLVGLPLVLAFVKMPTSTGHGDASTTSKAYLGGISATAIDLVKGALKTRHLGLATLLASASLAYLFGSTNWLPAYLREARGFSIREMGWLASLPPYATLVAVLFGGVLIDKIRRRHVPLIFVGSSVGVALSVLLAICSDDRYLATAGLIAGSFFWGLQGAAIPSTVIHFSRPEHTASAYGVVIRCHICGAILSEIRRNIHGLACRLAALAYLDRTIRQESLQRLRQSSGLRVRHLRLHQGLRRYCTRAHHGSALPRAPPSALWITESDLGRWSFRQRQRLPAPCTCAVSRSIRPEAIEPESTHVALLQMEGM